MSVFPFPVSPIAFLTGIFYLNMISRVILGPFLPVIERELGLGHGEAGSLFFFIQLGYATGLLGSGFVSSRITYRRTVLVSCLAVGVALLGLSRASTLGQIILWLVLIGAAAGLYLPSGIATITHAVPEAHWGKALAVHELAPNLGFVTAPLLAETLLAAVSWRGVLVVVGGGAILLAGCFAVWGRWGDQRGEPPRLRILARLIRGSSIWVMGLLFAVGVGTGLGLYSMLPLFLVSEIGLPLRAANAVTGLSRVSSLFLIFVAGWLTDRLGDRRTLVLVLTATGVLTVALGALVGPTLTPVLVFVQAMSYPLFFPPAFAAISRVVPPQMRNVAVALATATGSLLGSGGVPTAVGYVAEAASFSTAISLVGLLALLSPLLLRLGKRTDSRP